MSSIFSRIVSNKADVLADMNFDFFNFYLKGSQQAMVVSGYSGLLGMLPLYLGSGGKTMKKISQSVHKISQKDLLDEIMATEHILAKNGHVMTSNHLLFNISNDIKPEYPRLIKSLYCVSSHHDIKGMFEFVNSTTKTLTHDVIKQIFDENKLNPQWQFMIMNAITFQGQWATPFESVLTLNQTSAPSMFLCDHWFPYYETPTYKLLEIPYKDPNWVMGIVLTIGISAVPMTGKVLLRAIRKLKETKIGRLQLPKFSLETKLDLGRYLIHQNLSELLQSADFSPMFTNQTQSHISDMTHVTNLQIDENGSHSLEPNINVNANANSKTVLHRTNSHEKTSLLAPVVNAVNMIVTQPFMFYIRHKPLNAFILTGFYQ